MTRYKRWVLTVPLGRLVSFHFKHRKPVPLICNLRDVYYTGWEV